MFVFVKDSELVSVDGAFEADPLKRYNSEYWNVGRIFTSSYKSCAFALGSGYVGKVLKDGQPLWLTGVDALIKHSNTSSQAHFFKVAGIQTLVCIPWFNSVVELGSSSLLPLDPSLLIQIASFLSHMATSKQQRDDDYFPSGVPLLLDELSAGSDDASFNGGLISDQQVESCLSRDPLVKYSGSLSTQQGPAVAPDYDLGEALSGVGESDWTSDFASSEMLPQQMPLLSHLDYDLDSTSHSSPRVDDDIENFQTANMNSDLQLGSNSEHSSGWAQATEPTAAGFAPWKNTTSPQPVAQTRSSNSGQALLRESIKMTHKISELKASREKMEVAAAAAARQRTTNYVNHSTPSTAEDVLLGHDEAAINHMLAERKRRQKTKGELLCFAVIDSICEQGKKSGASCLNPTWQTLIFHEQ